MAMTYPFATGPNGNVSANTISIFNEGTGSMPAMALMIFSGTTSGSRKVVHQFSSVEQALNPDGLNQQCLFSPSHFSVGTTLSPGSNGISFNNNRGDTHFRVKLESEDSGGSYNTSLIKVTTDDLKIGVDYYDSDRVTLGRSLEFGWDDSGTENVMLKRSAYSDDSGDDSGAGGVGDGTQYLELCREGAFLRVNSQGGYQRAELVAYDPDYGEPANVEVVPSRAVQINGRDHFTASAKRISLMLANSISESLEINAKNGSLNLSADINISLSGTTFMRGQTGVYNSFGMDGGTGHTFSVATYNTIPKFTLKQYGSAYALSPIIWAGLIGTPSTTQQTATASYNPYGLTVNYSADTRTNYNSYKMSGTTINFSRSIGTDYIPIIIPNGGWTYPIATQIVSKTSTYFCFGLGDTAGAGKRVSAFIVIVRGGTSAF